MKILHISDPHYELETMRRLDLPVIVSFFSVEAGLVLAVPCAYVAWKALKAVGRTSEVPVGAHPADRPEHRYTTSATTTS